MLKKLCFYFSLILTSFIPLCSEQLSPLAQEETEQLAKRIRAQLILKDELAAYEEATQMMRRFSQSPLAYLSMIATLARLGEEKKMVATWHAYQEKFPQEPLQRQVVEEMAWGVLQKAALSSSFIIRQMALIAALLTQDVKGIEILYRGMQDSNYAIRATAVELAGQLPDAKLMDRMQLLFKQEKRWPVKKKVIAAVGTMKIKTLKPQLLAFIADPSSLAEERMLAIHALLKIQDFLERKEVLALVTSSRSGLRLLACQAIMHFESMRDLDQLVLLCKDFNAEVRAAALQAIGLLKPADLPQEVLILARKFVKESHCQLAIAAAWLLTLYYPEEGRDHFAFLLKNPKRRDCLLAAMALKATGKYGLPLSLQLFTSHKDPFIRLNLAEHVAQQQTETLKACQVIASVLKNNQQRWCLIEEGIFTGIATRQIFFNQEKEAEMEDQLLRLEMLNLLAMFKWPQAQEAIKQFLAERSWGVTGAAASLLLTEGDETAVEIVRNLLHDPSAKVRLQAALVLSLWSQEEEAIKTLEQSYSISAQEQKCHIVEALGRIGSMQSLPFLIDLLNEPSQTLRVIAALALIQCLHH